MTNINLEIAGKEIVAIVGPSGCGKSTLLNLIAGLIKEDRGKIDNQAGKIGYVFQEDRLLPWLTVYENIRVAGEKEDKDRIHELIHKMKLKGFEHYYPAQLSGGMRQRYGIARALYYGSSLLLMDEPFRSLDYGLRLEMLKQVKEIWKTEYTSVIFVTHDIEEALMVADRVLVFGKRPSTIIKEVRLPQTEQLRMVEEEMLVKVKAEIRELIA
ncbi:MAG: ATP-binding cassette domain-containing protein [Lachnospiraceae bacterium]|nr:ATP-binding cassette domain-containing protein [Lachnospiraceae bacterium]